MLRIKQLETAETFESLKAEWNQLLIQSSVDNVFLTWEWLSTWWKYYGQRYQLLILVAQEGEKTVGIAPLMRGKQTILGLKVHALQSLVYSASDVSGFIIPFGRDDVLQALTNHLIEIRSSWDVLLINEYSKKALDFQTFLEPFRKYCLIDIPETKHYTIPLLGQWDEYLKGLSTSMVKDLRRCQRRLEERGKLTYSRYSGAQVTPAHVETIFNIHSCSHHPEDFFAQSERLFQLELAYTMGSKGWMDISFLSLDGQPIAYHYGFLYEKKSSLWRTAFNSEFLSYAPGKLLLLHYIKDSYDRGIELIDWLVGDHKYKMKWQVNTQFYSSPRVVQKRFVPLLTYYFWPRLRHTIRLQLERSQNMYRFLKKYDGYRRMQQKTHMDVLSSPIKSSEKRTGDE